METIDGFVFNSQFLNQMFYYRNKDTYIMVDPLRNMIGAWQKDGDKEIPVFVSVETVGKLMEDANSRVHWN